MANSQAPTWGVTCSARADSTLCRRAVAIAQELESPYWDRPDGPLDDFIDTQQLDALIVVGQRDIVVHTPHARLRHHPNAAVLRVVNMLRDRRDAFVNLAQLMPGDHVLDCTCGMGADAIAAAHAVGESGAVRALEASPYWRSLPAAACSATDIPTTLPSPRLCVAYPYSTGTTKTFCPPVRTTPLTSSISILCLIKPSPNQTASMQGHLCPIRPPRSGLISAKLSALRDAAC